MKVLIFFLLWCLLLAVSWPIAVLVLVLLPFVWLLSIPFRILFFLVEGLLAFLHAVLVLPARLLGYRPGH